MRPRDTRKALKDLKALCREHGLEFSVVSGKGKGSHQGLLFRDPKTDEAVTLTIAGHDEISAGVQRELLRYVRGPGLRAALGGILRVIFERLFD